jgi:hypothetical protein
MLRGSPRCVRDHPVRLSDYNVRKPKRRGRWNAAGFVSVGDQQLNSAMVSSLF